MRSTQQQTAWTLATRAGLALAAALIAATAVADVTVEQKTVTNGLMGFGNGTSTSTLVVAGDRSRDDQEYTYTGRFKTLVGGKPTRTSSITRLDRELIWTIDPQKKQYTELTFAEMRERMVAATAEAQAEMKKEEPAETKPDVEMEYKLDVQRTGKKDTVNGFPAEQAIVTLTAVPKDKSSGAEGAAFNMKMDEWLSSAVPGQDQIRDYYKRMSEKLGLDLEAQQMGKAFMAQYGGAMKEMSAKLKDLKGYPVRSTLTVMSGPELTPEQKAELAKKKADADKARADAEKQQAASDRAEDVQQGASAASEAKGGNLKGAIGGFLARKAAKAAEKKAQKKAEESAASDTGEPKPVFTAVVEVLKVSTEPAGVSFDLPAGYKKVVEKEKK